MPNAGPFQVIGQDGVSVASPTNPLPVTGGGGGGGGDVNITAVGGNPVTTSVPVSGTIAATQSGTWTVSVTGTVDVSGSVVDAVQSGVWAVEQDGSWTVDAVQSGTWTVGVSGTVAATQSGTWTVGVSGTVDVSGSTIAATQSGVWSVGVTGTVAATQSGLWSVGITGTVDVSGSTVAATQSGSWTVGVSGAVAVTQSGTWTVDAVQSGTWNIGTVGSITNPVAATQSGTWNVGAVGSITGTVTVQGTSTPDSAVQGLPVLVGAYAQTPGVPFGSLSAGDSTWLLADLNGYLQVVHGLRKTAALTGARINISSSGDNTIISATSSQTTRVYRLQLTVSGPVVIQVKDGSTILSVYNFAGVGGGLILDLSEEPWFVTSTNTALVFNLSAGVQVDGRIEYLKSA